MRQSQTEIKAIEAELRSIRADKTSGRLVTLLEPNRQIEHEQPISPTISRPAIASPTNKAPSSGKASPKIRSVECFPLPQGNAQVNVLEPQLAAVVDQLRQQVHPSAQPDPHRSPVVTVADRKIVRQILEEKARQINSLSHQQETIIRELMLLSDRFEQELLSADTDFELDIDPICEYISAEVPYVDQERNGTLLLTTRSIDWTNDWAETGRPETGRPEAYGVAPAARRKPRQSLMAVLTHQVWQLASGAIGLLGAVGSIMTAPIRWLLLKEPELKEPEAPPRRKTYRGSGRRAVATESPFSLKSMVALMVGSAALRIFLDWVVVTYPILWVPSVLVMITPALFAVYRSTVTPQVGFTWGYRLFAIMIGLLLGGRL